MAHGGGKRYLKGPQQADEAAPEAARDFDELVQGFQTFVDMAQAQAQAQAQAGGRCQQPGCTKPVARAAGSVSCTQCSQRAKQEDAEQGATQQPGQAQQPEATPARPLPGRSRGFW